MADPEAGIGECFVPHRVIDRKFRDLAKGRQKSRRWLDDTCGTASDRPLGACQLAKRPEAPGNLGLLLAFEARGRDFKWTSSDVPDLSPKPSPLLGLHSVDRAIGIADSSASVIQRLRTVAASRGVTGHRNDLDSRCERWSHLISPQLTVHIYPRTTSKIRRPSCLSSQQRTGTGEAVETRG